MKKLKHSALKQRQLVDIRPKEHYLAGYIKDSIHLSIKNLEKYGHEMLSVNHPVVLITENDVDVEKLEQLVDQLKHLNVEGYMPFIQFPASMIARMPTISATDFLKKDHDFILLDVRQPERITKTAPKKNLKNIPLKHLADSLAHLDRTKEVYTLCNSSNGGTIAASYLIKNGYAATVIEDGMKGIEKVQK